MWKFGQKIRTLISRQRRHTEQPASDSRATDWLPPVLGPEDWSIGLMCDRSAGWYLDRR
ncbi:hypothetical protein [Dongia deserti]|uniref:hypothetical protein n=1 Tax=Dongia deserti TaxID=2268030 RepID=UPI0013C48B2D|nr:hypothetical protein [Dongia deserti]